MKVIVGTVLGAAIGGYVVYVVISKLDQLIELVQALALSTQAEGAAIMSVLDDLTAQVQANTDTEASAIQLIQNIAQALANAGTDPTKLAALQSQLKTSADALAAAVVANTPAAPPTPSSRRHP